MTTAPRPEPHPETPVVHLSRRAALEAERAAARSTTGRLARRTARATDTTHVRDTTGAGPATRTADAVHTAPRTRTAASARSVARAADASPATRTTDAVRPGRTATSARVATEHAAPRIRRVTAPTRPRTDTRSGRAGRASWLNPLRAANRASRVTMTSALAAFVLFAASATPAHAAGTGPVATAALAPNVQGQDYSVTELAALADPARDGFTIGGGTAGTPGTSVSAGGAVRSPFPGPVAMSSGFGYRSAPCGACSSLHEGLDFTPGLGTPIGAIAKGTVRVAGTYFNYGTAVVIDHEIDGRKVATLYGHMIPGSTPLQVGDEVEAGEFIGQVGNSGVSTGAHLHLEVLMDGVTPIDPEAWLEAKLGRSITA